jgi:hypothetical protein
MATLVTKGQNVEILNLTLSSTDDIQVGFINDINSIIIKARTAVDIQIRTTRNSNYYYTIPSGTSLEVDMTGVEISGGNRQISLWIRSLSATPVVEVIGTYGG